jgi:hypothetical protein
LPPPTNPWIQGVSLLQEAYYVDHGGVRELALPPVVHYELVLIGIEHMRGDVDEAEVVRGIRIHGSDETDEPADPADNHVHRARRPLSAAIAGGVAHRFGQPADQPRAGQVREVNQMVGAAQLHSEYDWAERRNGHLGCGNVLGSREMYPATSRSAHPVGTAEISGPSAGD